MQPLDHIYSIFENYSYQRQLNYLRDKTARKVGGVFKTTFYRQKKSQNKLAQRKEEES